MRTRANGCTRGNDTGDASGIRDGKTLPPVGPHRLLLPHRAATAAHRGLKELERTIVESTTILLGDSEESKEGWDGNSTDNKRKLAKMLMQFELDESLPLPYSVIAIGTGS